MDNLEWLHKHGRTQVSSSVPIDQIDQVLTSSAPPATDSKVGRVALDLVYHAAEVVKSIEDHANELETRARTLAGEATEQLKLAEKHIQELEAKQQAANACTSETHIKLQEAAEALKAEQARVIPAEKQLRQLEVDARTVETHARACENAFARVEDAIRARIIRQYTRASGQSTAAA